MKVDVEPLEKRNRRVSIEPVVGPGERFRGIGVRIVAVDIFHMIGRARLVIGDRIRIEQTLLAQIGDQGLE